MRSLPLRVAHLTTVDMSLELLLAAQLNAVVAAGGEAFGISAPGPYVEALTRRGITHVPLTASTRGMSLLADLRAMRQLWSALRRVRPTVLHTHNPKPGLYGRVIGRLAGVPIVVNTVHGLYATPDDRRLKRWIVYAAESFASRWSHAELAQSIEDVDTMRRWRLAARRKLRHLGNGVDLARFHPAARPPSDDGPVGSGPVVIGTVGRLVGEKGYVELFDAVRRLGDRARLMVIGGPDPDKPDSLAPEVLAAAEAAGVTLLGHRTDVDELYRTFDLFVLASHREGMPRAAMEAAASGLAVVATDIRGCRQVVDHGVTGLLVPPRDAPALAAALGELVDDRERRTQMGIAARQRAEAHFDERAVVATVMQCYAEVAERRGIKLVPAPAPASTTGSPPDRHAG